MKNRKLLVTLILLFSAVGFSQNPINGGFEAPISNITDWTLLAGTTVSTVNARTGVNSLAQTTSSNLATQDNLNATVISVPDTWWGHVIGWAKGSDINSRAQMRATLNVTNISGTLTAAGALNNILLQLTASSAQNGTGSPKNFTCRGVTARTASNGTPTTVYWDDVIMYTFNSATIDLTKPTAATTFTAGATLATSATFTWAYGTDGAAAGATGVQNTIILRTTNPSPAPLVMNDQGVYSTTGGVAGPKIVSTDWTVISTSVGATATSYTDATAVAGATYIYAVIHRDLAYNYSTALVGTAMTCPPSAITSTATGGLWSATSTWLTGVVPASNTDAVIATGATVTMDSATYSTRNAGTSTTVDSGGILVIGNGIAAMNYTNNGTTTINGTFKLNNAGTASGTDFVYNATTSTLILGNPITIAGTNAAWPAGSLPYNVSVTAGGLTINAGVSRSVSGTFLAAAAVALIPTAVLTISGICQINGGGNFSSAAPTYTNTSTLVYNVGGTPTVGNEWSSGSLPPTAGLGIPQNVTIQNSTALTTPATSRNMAGNLTITTGSLILGADFYIGGSWTRASVATFTPGTRKVTFYSGTANTTHTVTVSSTGTETFSTLEIQTTGMLRLATGTDVEVTGNNGLTLNTTNATAAVDLNGQSLTLSGGGNLTWFSGVRNITSAVAGGVFLIKTNGLTISVGGVSSLTSDSNTTLKLQAQFNLNSIPLTISGIAQMDTGGSFNTNSPIYTNSSTLSYTTGATFNRGYEWLALGVGTIGTTPGYPNNLQISNNTILNYNNGTPLAKAIYGNLTIASGSTFDMVNGTPTSAADLTIRGTVTNNGTFTFANVVSSVVVGGDFTNNGTVTLGTVLGADLKIASNFINTATFNGNNRAIFFSKSGTQTVSSTSALTIPYIVTSGTGTIVQFNCDVTISAPLGGYAVDFGTTSGIIDVYRKSSTVGNAVIIGTTGVACTINGTSGAFTGNILSSLTLLGTGSIGTLKFVTDFNLATFTINRTLATTTNACKMGSALNVNNSLVLTAGLLDLDSFNLTLAAAATIGGMPSVNNCVLADDTGGQLIKTFSAAGSFIYPVGENSGTIEYSPATLTFSGAGGTYGGTVGVRVVDAVHPNYNSTIDYLTRYWQVLVSGVAPTNYTFAGTYVAADIAGTENLSIPQCWNGTSWTDVGGSGIGSSTCTVSGTGFPYTTNEFSARTGVLYYRSKQTGNWNVATTWEVSPNNVSWSNAGAPPTSASETITILTGHTVTITADVTIDQVYVTGTLIASGASIGVTLNNGLGTDLTINNGGVVIMSITGSLASHGWIVSASNATAVLSGGTYIHNTVRAVSPFLDQTTFDTSSTMIYRGSSTLIPAVSLTNRIFGHLRFESTLGTMLITVPSFTTTCTCNDFFIGTSATLKTSSATTGAFAVSGNFTNNGTMDNSAGFFNFNFSGTTKTISGSSVPSFDTVNITGSYTLATTINFAYNLTTSILTVAAAGTLNNGGEYQITGAASPASVVINGKFITQDAQGFTGTNAAIPTMSTTVGTSSTVEYGGPTQTITAFTTYNNVTVSGTGTKTLLTTPIVMNGDLNVSASTLLVNTDQVIQVKKAVNVALSGATFEIKNNGQLVQDDDIVNTVNAYGSNTGSIIYNRTASLIKGYDYVYWSSPVTGPVTNQDISSIYSITTPGPKYFWNPTVPNVNSVSTGTSGNWQVASGEMSAGKGYIVRGSSWYGMPAQNIPATFTGVPSNGQITTTISRGTNTITPNQTGVNLASVSNLDDNWNLLGNPYPSAIDARSFLEDTNNASAVNGFVWLWRHNSTPTITTNVFYGTATSNYDKNDYIAYNSVGSNPPGFNGKIAAGQGFFVNMVDTGGASTQTVIFKNTMRKDKTTSAINNNAQFYRNSSPNITDVIVEKHRIWLDLVDLNSTTVSTLIGYAPEATYGLDRMYDAFKNIDNDKSIYSLVENQTMIIQGRPTPFDENDQVPIGVRILQDGDYKIAINAIDGLFEQGQPIFLEDKALSLIHDLRSEPYSFTAVAGRFDDRFLLRYTNITLANPDIETPDNRVVVASNHGEITITSALQNMEEVVVYDVLGRQLFFAKSINNTSFTAANITTSQQTLIVKIKLENGAVVTKKVIL